MRIEFLSIQQFRCFESFDVRLSPTCTVFFGKNGFGKSAIVEALRQVLALVPLMASSDAAPRLSDLRFTSSDVSRLTQRMPAADAYTIDARIVFGDAGVERAHDVGLRYGSDGDAKLTGSSAAKKFLQPKMPSRPVLAVYGAGRRWSGARVTEPGDGPFEGYLSALDAGDDPSALRGWWRRADHVAISTQIRDPRLQSVIEATQKFCGEGAEPPQYDAKLDDILIHIPALNGHFLLRELSDGYRGLLALVSDIARRAAMLNPAANSEDGGCVKNARGVVIIDEVDLHLHPALQLEVLPKLRAVFPNIQFVVTTHSPLILSSAPEGSIVYQLKIGGETVAIESSVRGADAITSLHQMDASARPVWAEKILKELSNAIGKAEAGAAPLEDARAALRQAENTLPQNDPALVAARAELDWLEQGPPDAEDRQG